jgi:TetR/AcrR family transcriptional repressor of nem operon
MLSNFIAVLTSNYYRLTIIDDRSILFLMTKAIKTKFNRERLLSEGVELFSEHGYHGIGLNGILNSVKIPKGSFYHYFKSKEDFGAKVVDFYTEMTKQQLTHAFAGTGLSGFVALQQFFDKSIEAHLDEGKKHGCLAANLGAEISDTSEVCRIAVEHSMNITRDMFEVVIQRGQKDGSIRQDINSVVLADILLNSFEGALLRMKIEKSGEPLNQFRDVVLNTFFAAP